MDTATHAEAGSREPTESMQSGHWLPALRPDTIDEVHEESKDEEPSSRNGDSNPFGRTMMTVVPPTPISQQNGHFGLSTEDAFTQPSIEDKPATGVTGAALSNGQGTHTTWTSQPSGGSLESDELPSDDDNERLDPAWGIKRLDTAHILDKVHRSTTFPEFNPPETAKDQPFIDTAKNGTVVEMVNGTTEASEATRQESGATEPQSLSWMNDDHDGTRDPQSWTIPAQSEMVDEEAVRFEEGVPLIQADETSPADPGAPDEGSQQNSFEAAQDDEESTFFSNISGSSATVPQNPSLDRKSTAQVLRSLDLPNDDRQESPPTSASAETSFFDELAAGTASKADNKMPVIPEDVDAMWAEALGDEEFLVEDADDLLPDSEPGSPSSFIASLQDSSTVPNIPPTEPAPNTVLQRQVQPRRESSVNSYAPHQPSTSDMLQLSPTTRTTHNNVGLSRPELAPMGSFQAQLQQEAQSQNVKSFVDQAKDGYKSPYDLPLELSKSRKRAHVPQPVQTTRSVAPPPRSSSLSEKPLQSPFLPNVPPMSGSGVMPPPAPSPAMPPRSVSAFASSRPEAPTSGSSSSFFEELPLASKPRHTGRHTPQHTMVAPPPPLPAQSPPVAPPPPQQHTSLPGPPDPYSQYQLRPPERLDPYANVPLQPPPVPAATTARYSPAPVTSTLGPRPGPSPRYSPAPPPQTATAPAARYAAQPTPPPAPSQSAAAMPNKPPSQHPHAGPAILPFQPRTSSPLAYHKSSVDENVNGVPLSVMQTSPPPAPATQLSPPGTTASYPITSPDRDGLVDSSQASATRQPTGEQLLPPRRSQTQSPSKQRPQGAFPVHSSDIINRPASAYGQPPPRRTIAPMEQHVPSARPSVRARGLAPETEFVRPQDDTQFDPLERWKGAPLFRFGFGGTVVSTFPKLVPRYATGAVRPQIKPTAGAVSIQTVKDVLPLAELWNQFPGPLRSKSKKKDVLSWMTNYISGMETDTPNIVHAPSHDGPSSRHHEKVLLWKVVRALVEHDGSLDGPALKAINLLLSPEVHNVDLSSPIQYREGEPASGIYRPPGANVRPDSVDPMAVETLRKRLLGGDREAAVFHAMDNRLWSHALIISSTMDRSVWSQVVREFVRQEVKTTGENTESLSALYEIFGGNLEESIDELVPPSARAGLQMVSKVDAGGPAKNALDGLNRWKETLSLVLNNRCQGDHQALAVLGKLLEDYNRIEAAHICYLFSRNPHRPVLFGGLDEDHAAIVLLGANHKTQPFDFGRDQDAILLTEIYEFATSILATGASLSFMPHLSVFKLQRAAAMAESGLRSEAQSYCDAIASTFKSSTKMSAYYHPLFLSELDDLSNRLKQTPVQGSSSWIGKPSLEKVGGSMWNKFSSFVAGDDSDAESKGSGKDAVDAGPFANVAGTPSISRPASQSDMYGSYPQSVPATVAGSRYAPNGMQSTRSSSELTRGRPSLDSQRSPPSTSHSQSNHQYEPMNMFQHVQAPPAANPYQAFATASPPNAFPQSPPRSSYAPNNSAQSVSANPPPMHPNTYAPTPPAEDAIRQSYGYTSEPAVPSQIPEEPASYSVYEPPQPGDSETPQQDVDAGMGFEAPTQSYGYEPPTGAGYVPYVPEPDSPEEAPNEVKSKKKSFMDDDDDDFPRISHQPQDSEPKSSVGDDTARKRANDAAAEAAFRAAAEADAAREKEKKESKRSSSWFGGWLGGKKAESLDAGPSKGVDQKVYKANLGESKMKLYFDKELGKWVNPDNPDAAKKTATPPPPRMGGTPGPPNSSGGPPRPPMTSTPPISHPSMPGLGMGPPSAPSSRAGTPAEAAGSSARPSSQIGVSGPPSATSTPPIGHPTTPGLAPPPRPATAMSNASSIDDLIGPATGRKPAKAGKKGPKSGRYVDVMAQ
ncbi:uncharacterized protein Z520_06106 [Fonsecaea multimorphosa CBS 102226]|uniref:Protein transport protein sec16 n=1 Tax=Fonsecaea multimorphosa CBS 102226 TaxID=1442371 RepID=A0A0D2JWS6_9EURO|nr:uncharacterized protein Z520_06106 [Fonsecaea multimorphosa CBS 102226]KIX98027.1 hypothetical protein Z520_06106 [Fonsecaea multimorphosa CBS 102226]OAL24395.1 hypothetical protein AYO22_05771 [Fonsecaea multimorphosa]